MRGAVHRMRAALRSLRARTALLSVAVVGATLIVGGGALLALYAQGVQNSLDQNLTGQATDRAALLDRGTDPDALVQVQQSESFVWIGTPDGAPVATAGNHVPIENPIPPSLGSGPSSPSGPVVATIDVDVEERSPDEVEVERAEMRVAAARSASGLVVVTGTEVEVIGQTVAQGARLLVSGLPIALVAAGIMGWAATGRALRPVEDIRDRTERLRADDLGDRVPVPDTDDEIRDLALTMNSMLDRLDDHQRAQRQFVADASHELKSPVANLRAMLDTATAARSGSLDRDRLSGEVDRLGDLIDNLLFLATRADGGRLTGATGPVHLDDLLFDEAALVTSTGRAAVTIDAIEPCTVTGHRGDLRRLVRNLVDNAARHATSRVTLGCRAESDGAAVIVVADDGDGIPEADRERVFDRFTRLDPARGRDAGGSGLGLAIVRQIATDHGGTITVTEPPGGGSRFEVRLAGTDAGRAAR